MITYQELLKSGENELVSSNISDAELDAWYLLEYITGMSRANPAQQEQPRFSVPFPKSFLL